MLAVMRKRWPAMSKGVAINATTLVASAFTAA
jgi:hypothetical protein